MEIAMACNKDDSHELLMEVLRCSADSYDGFSVFLKRLIPERLKSAARHFLYVFVALRDLPVSC